MTHDELKHTIKLLRSWSNGKLPPYTGCGICFNLPYYIDVYGYAATWPKRNPAATSRSYPIEGDSVAYANNKHKWIGDYGKLRRSLARHIAKELSKKLTTSESEHSQGVKE